MAKGRLIFIAIVLIIVVFSVSTIFSPIMIVAEDAEEDYSIDMAAIIGLGGFEWIYPGNSYNPSGGTLHDAHMQNPENPYGAVRDTMTHTYGITPHVIISVNNDAAAAIFGGSIVDDIRANDAYNGYGASNVPGTMDRGDAVGTAMANNGMNVFQVPIQLLMGNIQIHFA